MTDFLSKGAPVAAHGGLVRAVVPTLAALVVGLVSSAPSFAAGRVFHDGFDSNTDQWLQDESRHRCTIVQSALDGARGPNSGAGMLRCNWNGTLDWTAPDRFQTLQSPSWNYEGEFLIRFWIRADHDATDHPAHGPKIYRLHQSSYSGMNFRNGEENAAFYGAADQIGTTYWGQNPSPTQWHKYEIYVRQGTSDGIVRLWRDDIEVKSITGNTWPTEGSWSSASQSTGSWAPFWISSNWSGATGCCDHDANNHVYWDEFEIYSDSGTGATGSMADGTITVGNGAASPEPPLGVTVR